LLTGFLRLSERRNKIKLKTAVNKIIIYTILIIWAVISLFPIYWMITFSLKSNSEIFYSNPIGLPKVWRWSNYSSAFKTGNMGRYLLNSVIVTAVTIIITVMASVMAAFAMIRMKWKLSKTFMMILMLGLMVPIHAALLPVFIMMRKLHLINTLASLIIPYAAFAVPTGILITSGLIQSIPRSIEEAALIDGCSIYKMFFLVIFPLLSPAAASISIFTFLQSWNELMLAITFISSDKVKTLTIGIQTMSGMYYTEWGPIGAALTVATLPTMIIYLLLSKQVQKSFIAGSITGT